MTGDAVHEAVEEVVRTSYGRLVAYLAARTGDLAGAEDALADALEAALATWPTRGIPDRPVSWMITAARRSHIGRQRRADTAQRAAPTLALLAEERTDVSDSGIPDKRLELLFTCAHPSIDGGVHAPLMLQTVFGIDVARMSGVFLVEASTLGQRLVRAKRKIADARIPFVVPAAGELVGRVASVVEAIYTAYGTGWDDPAGLDPARAGLTTEAVRLADLLTELRPHDGEVLGLAALVHHLEARSGARRVDGEFVPLADQDPWRWSPAHLAAGEVMLNRALATGEPGAFTLMAAVSSLHNRRVFSEYLDWTTIAQLYDRLLPLRPTVGVAVARAAAHLESGSPERCAAALAAVDAAVVEHYQPYWTVRAELAARMGKGSETTATRRRALELTSDPAVRRHLERRWGPDAVLPD